MAENMVEPFQSLDSVISTTLNINFKWSQVEKHLFTPKELKKLAFALPDYYRKMNLPTKSEEELRPYISPSFVSGQKLGISTVISDPSQFNPSVGFGEMAKNIKKYLLYCHSICFHDPLQYVLDFFAFDPYSDTALAYLPMVKSILVEYSKMSELIKDKIIIPISDETFGLQPSLSLNKEEKAYLNSRLPDLSKVTGFLGGTVKEQQAKISFLQNRVDLFLPHQDYVTVLRELLHYSETKFTRKQIIEPFNAAILGEISVINPDAVSLDDIVKIRNNDELFSKFRNTFSGILSELYRNSNEYSDLDGEFKDRVKAELSMWEDEVTIKKRESPYTKKLLESGEKILIGAVGGAVTGFALGGPAGATIGAVAGGAIPPAIETIRDFLRVAWNFPSNATLRRHFLAIQNDK